MELGKGGCVLGPRNVRMLTALPGGLEALGQPYSLPTFCSLHPG